VIVTLDFASKGFLLMSSNLPINTPQDITAPTPQNTPLTHAPISTALSRPTVPDISEDAEPAEEPTSNVHEAVFSLVQGKLAGLIGRSSGYVESLPDGAKKTIEALKGVQVKQNDLQNQYKRECLELEKKACHPCSPVFFSPFPSIHHHPPSRLLLLPSNCYHGESSDHALFYLWHEGRDWYTCLRCLARCLIPSSVVFAPK
jgi:hypothetical protein